LKKYNGEFVIYDEPIHLEGRDPHKGRMIIFRFSSEKSAKDWYADNDDQAISKLRRAGTTMEFLTMVHGLSPR